MIEGLLMKDEFNEKMLSERNLDDYGDILDISDLMKILKISYPTALSLVTVKGEKDKIKSFRINKVWKIRKEDLKKFINEKVDYYKKNNKTKKEKEQK
jgi:hypothetical protein